ncbi:helix-turn-helix domain-containing protein [Actinomyces urogenitalis]|uniref:helix-turn-helix domain-containing protein n=1 Tax=Actinomyces urogenitalis TaxID=103621 RepID=UPI002904A333|nr:helix-turn-helix domain-containing protein [Actinomyces urogenitalis]MDU0864326.1 helix-turn-helix domain-containing protein [Actinomyces urogenitalis]MDU0874934.1 helix-turn-helix domain-containing protein [Actinomyces urogenitalis]MDU1564268.1 helix-turn-helix domain-containing protein [Actinomyces urogenitalis]MDU1639970.1 helix-turn-helix domain-containing protein [Actinomyces urogenitalis]MDU5427242.1 helix-turn-helix domain-containing protein [Actinomyces urogenitalis]
MTPRRTKTPAIASISTLQAEVLQHVANEEATRAGDARRARALLLATQGVSNATLARQTGASPTTTLAWRRQMAADGLASLALRRSGSGRPGSIPGLELARVADALTRNEHSRQPLSSRALAIRLGVSASTLTRVRADLRIGQGSSLPPRHHLVEVVGVLVARELAAVAVALDPATNAVFLRSRRGPHMRGSCPGGLVAAMGAVDLLRAHYLAEPARQPATPHHAEELAKEVNARWEGFLTELASQWPTGAHLHVVVTGAVQKPGGPAFGSLAPRRGPALLRVRHTASAGWAHGRMTMIARVLRAAGGRENLTALPQLLAALDRALADLEPGHGARGGTRTREAAASAHEQGLVWVAPRELAEAAARRSRADLIERTRGF